MYRQRRRNWSQLCARAGESTLHVTLIPIQPGLSSCCGINEVHTPHIPLSLQGLRLIDMRARRLFLVGAWFLSVVRGRVALSRAASGIVPAHTERPGTVTGSSRDQCRHHKRLFPPWISGGLGPGVPDAFSPSKNWNGKGAGIESGGLGRVTWFRGDDSRSFPEGNACSSIHRFHGLALPPSNKMVK